MSPAKVMLSAKERDLVTSTDWILTKNEVIGKVYLLFGGLNEAYLQLAASFPALIAEKNYFASPKIAKGEQYRQLPWVMLDQPRMFSAENVLAVRSFFWWGNFCSITLHLSGTYLEKYAGALKNYFAGQHSINESGWYYCISANAWEHHFDADNYVPLREEHILEPMGKPFIKIAKKIPLQEWDRVSLFFMENYQQILQMLAAAPDKTMPHLSDETNP
ncbi:MAG: hypothetical protein RLZZ28_111 [Bacteroidota bacterium]|jgi:hypothetical protein